MCSPVQQRVLLHPRSFKDQCAETLNLIANVAKSLFWKAEQNLHYVFLPIVLQHLGQEQRKLTEIAKRILIAPFAVTATLLFTPLALLGHCLTGLSNRLNSRKFVYLEGICEEKTTQSPKIMHLNACMLAGGLPYLFGGVATAGERFQKGLIPLINREDPDIVFLSEFSETMTPRLYESLKRKYKHFFVNIGSKAVGMDASLAVISKVALTKEPEFVPSTVKADGSQKFFSRGFFIMETKEYRYLYTHLHPQNTPASISIRSRQIQEIKRLIESKEGSTPWVVLGDLNIDRGSEGHQEMKESDFIDVIEEEHGPVSTAAEGLEKGSIKTEESLDYFLTVRDKPIAVQTQVIDTYTDKRNALSDHKAIVATLCFYTQNT